MWKPATNTRSVASRSRTRWRPVRRVSMLGPLMGNTGGKPMAKKARKKAAKKSAVKRTKTKVLKTRKARKPAAKKSKAKTKSKRTTKRARKSKTFGQRVASAISVVSDTITGTDKLRNKMEPPATSETE